MLVEGKAKRLYRGDRPGTVVMENKDNLSAGEGVRLAELGGVAKHKTAQAANVFRFLARLGIPVAFIEQRGAGLVCDECEMLPLELVTRRYPYGSLLAREPQHGHGGTPQPFADVRTEWFHKWTLVTAPAASTPELIPENDARARFLREGRWASGVYTDPYIRMQSDVWRLHPAKLPFREEAFLLEIAPLCSEQERAHIEATLMRPCFLALEQALAGVQVGGAPVALVDMKIEVGRRKRDGALVIADVVDNDNWRIWPGGDPSKQLDKQAFREGAELATVAKNYALATWITEQL
jgi:phosphoribosylaminoimidazole-succinocarboxamide synthase